MLFSLAVSLSGSFRPGVEGLGGEGIVGVWECSRTEFGQGFLCLEVTFPIGIVAG